MLRKLTLATLALGMLALPTSAFAGPKKICQDAEGKLVVKKSCKAALGHSEYVPAAGPAAQGEPGDSLVLCYANVKSDGSLLSYGGHGTSGITVSRLSAGKYQVTCNGDYPGISGSYDTVKLASVQSVSTLKRTIHTTNGANSETELSTTVRTFNSADNASDQYFSLVVMGETS